MLVITLSNAILMIYHNNIYKIYFKFKNKHTMLQKYNYKIY